VGLTSWATGGAGGSDRVIEIDLNGPNRPCRAMPGRACAQRATRAERRAKRAVPKQPGGLTARPKHDTVRALGQPGHD
jgi:hypothetical protein